jgi:hypothetical protein
VLASEAPPVKYEVARNHEGVWAFRIPARSPAWLDSNPAWNWADALDAAERHRICDPWAEVARNAREYIDLDALRSAAWLDAAARGGDA